MDNNGKAKSKSDYIGYEYKILTVDCKQASFYTDAYANFGWALDESLPIKQHCGTVTIKLKRDRKTINKTELTRLQQHFEACADEINILEKSKTRMATVLSIIVGIVGTVFMAGAVFAVVNEPPIIWLCALLGVPGLVCWALPLRVFKAAVTKRTAEITPIIEQKYDEIHDICEKGNSICS